MHSTFQQINQGDVQTSRETEVSQAASTWTYPRLCYRVGKHSTHVREDLKQQSAIGAVLIEGRNTHLIPNSKKWDTIDGLIGVCKPFQKATEAMSGVKCSISTVKPLLFKMLKITLKVNDPLPRGLRKQWVLI